MKVENIVTVRELARSISKMRAMTRAAIAEQDVWLERLKALRGKGNADAAYKRCRALGEKEVLRRLERLVWPPDREDFAANCKHGCWPQTQLEKALAAYPDPGMRLELTMFLGVQDQRDRFKARTQYWEIFGVHPDDVDEHDKFNPHAGFNLFVYIKTCEELAKRFNAHDKTKTKLYEALVGAYKMIIPIFLGLGKRPLSLSRMRQDFAEALAEFEATKQTLSEKGAAQPRFRLKVEGRPEVLGPTEAQLFEAVDTLTPLGGPGFLLLESPGAHYVQAAGGDGMYAVESREWLDDSFESFKHYVAGKEGDHDEYVTIPTNGAQVTVRENECLDASDVKRILSAFLRGRKRLASYAWRDISDNF